MDEDLNCKLVKVISDLTGDLKPGEQGKEVDRDLQRTASDPGKAQRRRSPHYHFENGEWPWTKANILSW